MLAITSSWTCGGLPDVELTLLAAQLTVAETHFFRHPDQFRACAEVALPERLQAQATCRQLRLLSAGCASGEEAYSLAILLQENVPNRASWDVRVIGIDVNAALLAKAREARYTAWSLRGLSEDTQMRYFRPAGKEHILDVAVRDLVSFEKRNLVQEEFGFWQADRFDVIFCRNVTMYFTPESTRAVIARLTRSLAPGGFLFLGSAETLRGISQDYHLRHTHDAFYYQRRPAEEKGSPRRALETEGSVEVWLPILAAADESWVGAICQASERIARLSRGLVDDTPSPVESERGLAPAKERTKRGLGAARELVRQERFDDALGILQALPGEEARDPDAQLLRAVILTNRGQVAEAEHLCRQVLAGDDLNAEAHYLLALCREHAGEYAAAAEENQAAVYLDPRFAMPHLHLGLLAKRAGNQESALRAFRQACALLPREDASRILLFGGGFSREVLLHLCQMELQVCGGFS